MENEKIYGIDFVICPYCNLEMQQITPSHLKKHNITMKNLKDSFHNYKVISDKRISQLKSSVKEKYGVDNISKLNEIKEKKKETFLKNYGSTNCFSNDQIKEKIKKTNLEKYGYDNPAKNEIIKDKIKSTFINQYGGNPLYSEIIKNKIKETNLKKYGCECVFSSPKIKQKIIKTNIEKFGCNNPSQNEKIKLIKNNTMLTNFRKKLETIYCPKLEIKLMDTLYLSSIHWHKWKCLKCQSEFTQPWYHFQLGLKCPNCYPRSKSFNGSSKAEKEIFNFIKDLGFEKLIENDRKIIKPFELDIVIEDLKIAIEYCGLYWHSEEKCTNKNYHLHKYNKSLENGYRLITIFEDEWLFKQDLVKARLKYILNKSNADRIFARKCKIQEINATLKNEFLEKYHIQGKDISSINLGAFYNNELVSVMTFSKGNISKGSKSVDKIYELNRFCVNYNYQIPGIASKLLKYFEKNFVWIQIFSYSDKRWNTGNLYNNLNFKEINHTSVNYWYIKAFKRFHRFGLRKRKDEPKNIPEHILRLSEGYIRIFDCGNIKYVKENNIN